MIESVRKKQTRDLTHRRISHKENVRKVNSHCARPDCKEKLLEEVREPVS